MSAPVLPAASPGGPSVALSFFLGGSALAALLAAAPLGNTGMGAAVLLFAGAAALVVRETGFDAVFGWANAITLLRAACASVLGGVAADLPQDVAGSGVYVFSALLAAFALASDGADGVIARRTGSASAFGARFDMEVDALLIMVLSVLVWRLGQAGAWILLAGLIRYAFVGAAAIWPFLAAALPPSFRRKAICVVQVGALVLMLIVSPFYAGIVGAAAVSLLIASFAIDIVWLIRNARSAAA